MVRLYINSAADSPPASLLENTLISIRKIRYIAKAQKTKFRTVDVFIVGDDMEPLVELVVEGEDDDDPPRELYNGV
jgi:hypothetical protein